MSNCILAYYVKHQKPLRDEIFRHLRGDAGEDLPPMLLTRLAKIPIEGTVLADRGFYFDAPNYPNVNALTLPHARSLTPFLPTPKCSSMIVSSNFTFQQHEHFLASN